MLTPEGEYQLAKIRWEAEPETQAALKFIVTTLTLPESDGMSMLERVYRTCPYENQRNAEIEAAGFAFLSKRFRNEYCFFQADCPDDGRVRFKLRIADHPNDVRKVPPANEEYNLNLLKDMEEWVIPPTLTLVKSAPPEAAAPVVPERKPMPEPRKVRRLP